MDKLSKLSEYLKAYNKLAVAYSAGVDSTFLLWEARKALGDGCGAFMVRMPFVPEREYEEAVGFCRENHIVLHTIDVDILSDDEVCANPLDRCYLCKKKVFGTILKRAGELGYDALAEGSNTDDVNDYRPGMKAIKELKVISPLLENGFSKEDIRKYSKAAGLVTYKKPSFACLASRFPYGTRLTQQDLRRVELSEYHLRSLGFAQYRVRIEGANARIELPLEDIERAVAPDIRQSILSKLQELGFERVTLDLAGFKSGSMNPKAE